MLSRVKIAQCAAFITPLLALMALNAAAQEPITFKLTGVRPITANEFQNEMQKARVKVSEWWGATFDGPISVETDMQRVLSMALIPAWRGQRGQMIFGTKRVQAGEAATVHEMIHVYAPNANRFLAEGLAVYAHDLLGGPPAHPNFGKNLDQLAVRSASRELTFALERVATPAPLEETSKDAYAIAGSFVKFLIEQYGMEQFRALYALTPLMPMQRNAGAADRWQTIYGQSLESLTDGWLAALRNPKEKK